MKISINREQKKFILFNVIYLGLVFLTCAIPKTNMAFRIEIYVYYFFLIALFIRNCIYSNIDVIDFVTFFFLMYNIGATLLFSSNELLRKYEQFLGTNINCTEQGVRKYLTVMLISAMCYSIVFVKKNVRKHLGIDFKFLFHFFQNTKFKRLTTKQFILLSGAVVVSVFFLYVYRVTGGVYVLYSSLQNAGTLLNIIGWLSVIISGMIMATFYKGANNNKFIYMVLFLFVILSWMLKIRMYCALYLIEFVFLKYIEGVRFGLKHIVIIGTLGVLLLFGNVLRFQTYNFGNIYFDIFTIFGEFIASSVSGYYLINNPAGFSDVFRSRDLILQFLPSKIRPVSSLNIFEAFYAQRNIKVWPIGGILFQGQVYFYFGLLFPLIFLAVTGYLLHVRKLADEGKITITVAMFSIFCMVMPRLQIWSMRSMLISGIVYFLFSRMFSFRTASGYNFRKREKVDGKENGF